MTRLLDCAATVALALAALPPAAGAEEPPIAMFGGGPTRNMASAETGLPATYPFGV